MPAGIALLRGGPQARLPRRDPGCSTASGGRVKLMPRGAMAATPPAQPGGLGAWRPAGHSVATVATCLQPLPSSSGPGQPGGCKGNAWLRLSLAAPRGPSSRPCVGAAARSRTCVAGPVFAPYQTQRLC